jgi:hypothetical protein
VRDDVQHSAHEPRVRRHDGVEQFVARNRLGFRGGELRLTPQVGLRRSREIAEQDERGKKSFQSHIDLLI